MDQLLTALLAANIPFSVSSFFTGGDRLYRVRIIGPDTSIAEGTVDTIEKASAWLTTEAKKAWPDAGL